MPSAKITKKELLDEIESRIQALNLLKSALLGERSRKPEVLADYEKQFHDLVALKKKK